MSTVLDWLSRYGSYGFITAGWLIFSIVIPSASGPADVLARGRAAPPAASGRVPEVAPLLIGSSAFTSVTRGAETSGAVVGGTQPSPAAPNATPPEISGGTQAPPATPEPTATGSVPTAAPTLPLPLAGTDRIVIPRIKLDTKVVDVGVLPNGEMETAAYAAGRLSFGAEAGETGNVVLAGHNDVLGEVFRRLPELQPGDEIVLYRGEKAYRYQVESRTIVREQGATDAQRRENARWMDPTDEPVCTLISCYPYRVDTHRYIVRARLTE